MKMSGTPVTSKNAKEELYDLYHMLYNISYVLELMDYSIEDWLGIYSNRDSITPKIRGVIGLIGVLTQDIKEITKKMSDLQRTFEHLKMEI
jgi:hypothetical protein